MKFKDYVEALNKVLLEHPESAEYNCVYSIDDEGNGYQSVHYTGTIGLHNVEYSGEFTPIDQFEDEEIEEAPNAVCIN